MTSATSEAEKIARRSEGHELRRAIKQAKKFTRVTKLVGKFVRPVGYAMDAWDIVTAAPKDRGRQIAKVAGGIGGGIAGGAAAGALLGTFLMPGVGTAIGGAIGGLIGAMAGEKLATGLYDSIFGRRNKHKNMRVAALSPSRISDWSAKPGRKPSSPFRLESGIEVLTFGSALGACWAFVHTLSEGSLAL